MKLLRLRHEEMRKLGDDMWNSAMTIKNNALQFAWYMRGGISYTDILNLSSQEFKFVSKIISDNLETTKNTKLPFI